MSVDKFGRHTTSGHGRTTPLALSNDVKIKKRKSADFDVENKRLCNVANPIDFQDAVNRRYFESKVPTQLSKAYSFHSYGIKDVAFPREDDDAVTLGYLKTNSVLVKDNTFVDARSLRIGNVGAPEEADDVVTRAYMADNIMCTSINLGSAYDAMFKRIQRLAKPQDLDDAVSRRYLKEAMADLAYTVYLKLLRGSRSGSLSRDEWDTKVAQDKPWSELFESI